MEVLMGVRGSAVHKGGRGGKPRWGIDFRYRDRDGRARRYRRDAPVRSAATARAEAERPRIQAVTTGTLELKSGTSTFRDFSEGPFTRLYMAEKCRPATRDRYKSLFGQGIFEA